MGGREGGREGENGNLERDILQTQVSSLSRARHSASPVVPAAGVTREREKCQDPHARVCERDAPTSYIYSPLRMLASDNYAWVYLRRREARPGGSLETRPSPSSTRACSVSYNYAWEYFRRQKAWYILSRDACRDCHKASSCGAVSL